MRPSFGAALPFLLAVGACATPSTPMPTAQAGPGPAAPKAAANKPSTCGLRSLGFSVRPGEDAQVIFSVKPDSQWCFDGIRLYNTVTEGQAIATPPSHGDLRLVHQPGAIVFGYRPAPGFTGSDRFRISIPSEIQTIYLAGNVTVAP